MFAVLFALIFIKRANCKLISITQITSDDPAGEMASKIFSLFDEYQSKENGKHTLHAMKENARRGFINGSKPPYGYRAVEVDIEGAKGKKKKRIDVDPIESVIVQRIYDWYPHGNEQGAMGTKEIATYSEQQKYADAHPAMESEQGIWNPVQQNVHWRVLLQQNRQ